MNAETQRTAEGHPPPLWPLRLAVFDLDGTLKEAFSPWRYLHEALGVEEQAARYRARFLAGEINYLEWARLDAALWKGTELAEVEAIFRDSRYRPGVHALFGLLQRLRIRTAIISTGLDAHARRVATELGVWRTVTNELLVRDGRLTGEVRVHITEHSKGEAMTRLREEAGARPEECLAVGDGPADVDLFAQAALAVAVCPREERVRRAAHFVVEDGNLASIIPLLAQRFRLGQA
jgi:phosphoserine phosphatase